MRAGHSTLVMPASNAATGSFKPAARKAAIAAPAFSN